MSRDWPQQVPRARVLANFRQPRYGGSLNAISNWRDKREGMSAKHLVLIRQLPCSLCPSTGVDPHHLKSLAAAKERGVGLKATDKWTVPLCRFHHSDIERLGSRREVAWFMDHGIDPHALAHGLWLATGDLGRMLSVLRAHQEHGGILLEKFQQRAGRAP